MQSSTFGPSLGRIATAFAAAFSTLLACTFPARAIVDGAKVGPRTYPFVVSLIESQAPLGQELDYHFCGGTLVAPQWVLTVANCLYVGLQRQGPADWQVHAGADGFEGGDRVTVDRVEIHPHHDRLSGQNDIALLHLVRPPRFEAGFRPVETTSDPNLEFHLPQGPVRALGWGPTGRAPEASPWLNSVDLHLHFLGCPFDLEVLSARWPAVREILNQLRIGTPVQDEIYSRVAAANPKFIPAHAFCAAEGPFSMAAKLRPAIGWRDRLRPGPCGSDAGGPLIEARPDGKLVQIGIIDFPFGYEAAPCDSRQLPPFFVSVGAYADWIASVMSKP